MARKRSAISTAIWQDEDWTALSVDAQWLYQALLAQPRLTLAGSLDMMPRRWSKLAAGLTLDALDDALSGLVAAGFVVIDEHTEELVVRTFVRHDIPENRANSNLVKGLWSAWGSIQSAHLRQVVVDNLPEWVFGERWGNLAPESITKPQVKPEIGPPFDPDPDPPSSPGLPVPSEPPPPSPSLLLPPSVVVPPTSDPERSDPTSDDDDAFGEVLHAVAVARGHRLRPDDPPRAPWLAKVVTSLPADRVRALHAAGRTPEQIDVELDQPASPADATATAQHNRLTEPRCLTCRGTSWVIPDDTDAAVPCPTCQTNRRTA